MNILCAFGRYQYGEERRGLSTEYQAFYQTFVELGHQVSIFDTWDKSEYATYDALNFHFIQCVFNTKPDLIFWVPLQHDLYTETIDLIRQKMGMPVVMWGTDDSWKYWQQTRLLARHVDLAVTTSGSVWKIYKQTGVNALHASWGIPESWIPSAPKVSDWKYSVSFVGTATPYRRKFIERLRQQGVNVQAFGYGWESGPIRIDQIPDILSQSYITLNFSDSRSGKQTKARLFEATGCGTCLLTESSQDLGDFFSEDGHLITFSTVEECKVKIDFLLSSIDARNFLAKNGMAKTAAEYTYRKICSDILTMAVPLISKVRGREIDDTWSVEFQKLETVKFRNQNYERAAHWMYLRAKKSATFKKMLKGTRRLLIYSMALLTPRMTYSRRSLLNYFWRGV